MGRGIALDVNNRFSVATLLGKLLKESGNQCYNLGIHKLNNRNGNDIHFTLFSFPTKNNWRDNSDIKLIEKSCNELVKLCDDNNIEFCLLTPVGCANGHLDYKTCVYPVISKILDDRFYVVFR